MGDVSGDEVMDRVKEEVRERGFPKASFESLDLHFEQRENGTGKTMVIEGDLYERNQQKRLGHTYYLILREV